MKAMKNKGALLLVFILGLFIFGPAVFAQQGSFSANNEKLAPIVISRIELKGNKIVSTATIFSKIKTRANQPYNENAVNEDVKRLYALGFFERVWVEKKDTQQGVVVVFHFKERPVIKKLEFKGNRFIRIKKIQQEISLKEGSFLDPIKLKETKAKLKQLYTKKGFSQAEITYAIDVDKAKNEATVKFIINESAKIKVARVLFEGNKTFSARRLIKLIKTRPAWLLNAGIFKEEVVSDDLNRLKEFYKDQGFGDVKVTDKIESYKNKTSRLKVIFVIQEGQRYYTGTTKIEGNKDISAKEIRETLTLKEGDVFSQKALRAAVASIQGLYFDKGYIFAQVSPFTFYNPKTKKVDITYKIKENHIAYVERIEIRGNEKTQDKVIRRELKIHPGDKFEGTKIKESKRRLQNLGFFEEIRFDSEPGTKPDWENLITEVKEAKTGSFSFGGGYSSIDEFIGFIELRQKNFDYKNWKTFTGAGQDLSLYASLGSVTQRYELSFTNPWIFDKPISFGFDIYKKGHDQEEDVGYAYQETVTGGDIRLGKQFNDYLSGRIAYRFDVVKISDIVSDASQDLKNEEGENDLSSIELGLTYDKRDNVFDPHKGYILSTSIQVTGGPFGGDKDFTKLYARGSIYFPLIHKSVLEFRVRAGIEDPFSNTSKVPIYERFFAGGAYTIRGYHERKVGPIDSATNDPIGGEAMLIGNIEYTYPLLDFLKVATFFDTGNVWAKNSDFGSGGFKSSIGLGIRVKTPIGPVSVDYGWPLDTEPGETGKEGRFHFSVSRGF